MIEGIQETAAGNSVVALFSDSTLSFALPKTATLADLVERLAEYGDRHGGMPLMVKVNGRTLRN